MAADLARAQSGQRQSGAEAERVKSELLETRDELAGTRDMVSRLQDALDNAADAAQEAHEERQAVLLAMQHQADHMKVRSHWTSRCSRWFYIANPHADPLGLLRRKWRR
jgi:chromosome segregation ATPase